MMNLHWSYECFVLFNLGIISRRDPGSLVKPLKSNSSEKETKNRENELEKQRPTATRHLLLIRHGQYNLEGKEDSDRYLTKLGKLKYKLCFSSSLSWCKNVEWRGWGRLLRCAVLVIIFVKNILYLWIVYSELGDR